MLHIEWTENFKDCDFDVTVGEFLFKEKTL